VERIGLRVVPGGVASTAAEAIGPAPEDPVAFQEECLRAFEASQVARGFSEVTIGNGAGTLARFLAACGRPAWEVTREDVDRVVGELAAQGLAASTRRLYVQVFKNFHAFLVARKAAAIEAAFGVRLDSPVDEFNAARHVGADSPSAIPPPGPERLEDFFAFLRERIAGARKYAAAGRDYALFRTLYLAGLRADEAAMMDRSGVHFGRGPFGKLHVRFGKGARTSGPRPRWVPMLDGLDLILRWYLDEIRPRMGDGPALFCDEGGGRIHRGTIRNRLACLLELEDAAARGRGEPGGAGEEPAVQIRWRLRMAAAQREVWTGAQLRRLLAERAGLHLSAASVSALLTRQPAQVKLETLAALCTALQCTPGDLIEVDTTPVPQPAPRPAVARQEPRAARGRSLPPL
jgi:site-specific recombinase XerD/DNA-binding Xre family transcriptional regulator